MLLRTVLRRIAYALLTMLLASLLVFTALQALPGDLATQLLGRDATPLGAALHAGAQDHLAPARREAPLCPSAASG